MKLKEKLGIDAVAKFSVENPQWEMDTRMLSIYLAGFEKAREMYRKRLHEVVSNLKTPEDKSAVITGIVFSVDIGEEEVEDATR